MDPTKFQPALLALEDGTVFRGISIGDESDATGEVVFNTAMSGYQEIVSDASYRKQIVTLTYPQIGNVGCNLEDMESKVAQAAGLVIRDLPLLASNFRSQSSLSDWLKSQAVPAIAGIDTRKLTRILRTKGSQRGFIASGEMSDASAIEKAKSFPGLSGMDLASVVTCETPYQWVDPEWTLNSSAGLKKPDSNATRKKVVAYDFGVKHNILRMLVSRGCEVTVVPARTPFEKVLEQSPDGVFLSNGPGDPEPCDYAIHAIQKLLDENLPIFGICLGHQLLALASGAKTQKMKFGHHGANHPVKDVQSGRVFITSQNHGFQVDVNTLPETLKVTHLSLFDGSLQGIERTDKPAFSFQGHPEASPGPHDIGYLFDRFVKQMDLYKR